MASRETKDLMRDFIALVLVAAVIGIVLFATWVSRTVNDTTPITNIANAT